MDADARTDAPLPGPAGLPLAGSLLDFRRDRLGFVTELARRHGDVAAFRLGPQLVVLLSHPAMVHELLVEAAEDTVKSPVLRRAKVLLGEGLLTSEGALHRRQRRQVQPALTARQVAGYAPAMVAAARRMTAAWEGGGVREVHTDVLGLTVTAAGRALLAADTTAGAARVGAAVDDVLAAYDTLFLPFPRLVQRLPLPALRRLRRGARWLDGYVRDLIAARRSGARGGDVLSRLLDAGMSERQLRDEVVTLLLAGHETTASALTWALHLLAADPQLQERLHGEVAAAVGDRDPAAEDVARLPGVRGLLAESLRLYPPSWAMGRELVRRRPVAGVELPAGTAVLVSQWVVHRDPRWWPAPDRVDPARWHGGAQAPRGAYFPFGEGHRRCVGEAFAWTEGVLALAVVLSGWRLAPVAGARPVPEASLTLRPRGVRLRTQPR